MRDQTQRHNRAENPDDPQPNHGQTEDVVPEEGHPHFFGPRALFDVSRSQKASPHSVREVECVEDEEEGEEA